MSILSFKPREKQEPRTRGRHRYSPAAAEAAIRQAEGERDDALRRAGEFEAAYYAERVRARKHEAAYWQLEKLVDKQADDEIGHITVPPMVRDTTDPAAQATAPHGVRTVNGPAAVMPLAEAAKSGWFTGEPRIGPVVRVAPTAADPAHVPSWAAKDTDTRELPVADAGGGTDEEVA